MSWAVRFHQFIDLLFVQLVHLHALLLVVMSVMHVIVAGRQLLSETCTSRNLFRYHSMNVQAQACASALTHACQLAKILTNKEHGVTSQSFVILLEIV